MEPDLVAELRRRGHRVTTARRAVLTTLLESSDHLTADQIAEAVKRRNPDIDTSTVYRTLGLFEELGFVEHAHLGHGAAVYQLGRTHQHLVCEECGAVVDIPVSALDDLARNLRTGYQFEIRPGHFPLLGRCSRHTDAAARDTVHSHSQREHTHG